MSDATAYQLIDKFHAHLDVCSQCRNHPFGLCSVGARLLREAAEGGKGLFEGTGLEKREVNGDAS